MNDTVKEKFRRAEWKTKLRVEKEKTVRSIQGEDKNKQKNQCEIMSKEICRESFVGQSGK